ncbi:hypothetical protein CVIRNUC_010174 [Coccomyxa viridis]|uniref:peptidylprolyl isomerase n=1 Tax=Coccomyxa viridis TaxID=1274662 RepID=A0AAV1IL56_9CHLO|nr:hypothetical protein CVIRNUC_010174 [Coccomyxa viridis]
MAKKLLQYLEVLKNPPQAPSFDPEIDDIDAEQDRKIRELDDLHSGAIRKGALPDSRPEGDANPKDGDLVFFHLTVRKQNEEILETTRLTEDGAEGSGIPKAFIIGKGQRMPRGWELALYDMRRGEKARLMMRPEYGYATKGCKLPPPQGCSRDADYLFDMHLVNWVAKDSVRVANDEGDVYKVSMSEPDSWETPRPPFEVDVSCTARVPSSSGQPGQGQSYSSSSPHQPLHWVIGSSQVPVGFEDGICSLAKGERAFISCPVSKARSEGSHALLPDPPDGADRVEFEVELLRMIQVRDLTGTGEVTKRRIKEGVGEFPVDCPLEDCAVRVHYSACLAGSSEVIFTTRGPDGSAAPVEFNTGMDEVPEAIDMAVRLMTPQEVSLVSAKARLAFQHRSDRPERIPEGADIDFEVELVGFDKQPNWHHAGPDEKIARAQALKEQGNAIFRQGPSQYARARSKWLRAMKMLEHAFDLETDEQMALASKAKVDSMTNLATVAFKEDNFQDCFKWCDKALSEVNDHPKALFRRATANAALMNYEAAMEDFSLCKEVSPALARDVDREVALMEKQRKEADVKHRQALKGFLGGK